MRDWSMRRPRGRDTLREMLGGARSGPKRGSTAGPREASLPPPVPVGLTDTLDAYFHKRVRQLDSETYMGVPIGKFPEDLRAYEHLLWASRASVVIEVGTNRGGSALWFRDRLWAMARYGRITAGHVYSVDLDRERCREHIDATDPTGITLIEGDICDPAVAAHVVELVPPNSRCFVVEDSAHSYKTTMAALSGLAQLVPLGGYFVVEDGCVDINAMRVLDDWPRGVLPAIDDWLRSPQGSGFEQRRDLELYGLTCHPRGFLQRVRAPVRGVRRQLTRFLRSRKQRR